MNSKMGRGEGEKEAKRRRGRSSKRSRDASPSPSSDSDSSPSPSSASSPSRSPEPRSLSSGKQKRSASSSSRRHRHKSSDHSRSSRDDDRRRHSSRSDSDHSDRVEEAEEIVRGILSEFPAVATELCQLLQSIDSGEGIDISGISDKPLVKRLKKLFRSMKLKESVNGAYLLPPKSVPTLDVVGPALVGSAKLGDNQNENVALRERQVPPPNFDVQNRDAISPEDGGQVDRVEYAPVKRIIGPAMPSRELLSAAAEMTEALRCRHTVETSYIQW